MFPSFVIIGGGYSDGWHRLIFTKGLGGTPVQIAEPPTLHATSEDYQQQLLDLLPPGPAWSREPDSVMAKTLHGFAEVFSRVHNRALALFAEVDPRTTNELLLAWERVAGLPEPCVDSPDTLTGRRNALTEKLTRRGRQNRRYFIDLAAKAGFFITIMEFAPFTAGDTAGSPIYGQPWRWAFQVNAPTESITFVLTAGSTAGNPLRDWGNGRLECLINRLKPAHTHAIYNYGG